MKLSSQYWQQSYFLSVVYVFGLFKGTNQKRDETTSGGIKMLIDELKPMLGHISLRKPKQRRKNEDVLRTMMHRARQLKRFRARDMVDITTNQSANLKKLIKQGKLTKDGWYYEVVE